MRESSHPFTEYYATVNHGFILRVEKCENWGEIRLKNQIQVVIVTEKKNRRGPRCFTDWLIDWLKKRLTAAVDFDFSPVTLWEDGRWPVAVRRLSLSVAIEHPWWRKWCADRGRWFVVVVAFVIGLLSWIFRNAHLFWKTTQKCSPMNPMNNQSINQSINRSINQSIKRTVNQFKRTVNQFKSNRWNQSNQSINRSREGSINQWTKNYPGKNGKRRLTMKPVWFVIGSGKVFLARTVDVPLGLFVAPWRPHPALLCWLHVHWHEFVTWIPTCARPFSRSVSTSHAKIPAFSPEKMRCNRWENFASATAGHVTDQFHNSKKKWHDTRQTTSDKVQK